VAEWFDGDGSGGGGAAKRGARLERGFNGAYDSSPPLGGVRFDGRGCFETPSISALMLWMSSGLG
jgi:hypothetical protein